MINANTKAALVGLRPASIPTQTSTFSQIQLLPTQLLDCKSSLLGCIATATQSHLQKVSPTCFSLNFLDSRNKQASW